MTITAFHDTPEYISSILQLCCRHKQTHVAVFLTLFQSQQKMVQLHHAKRLANHTTYLVLETDMAVLGWPPWTKANQWNGLNHGFELEMVT